MLPSLYFNRLTHALGVRTDNRQAERRKSVRVPVTFRPEFFPVSAGCLVKPLRVRARDISSSGVGLLVPKDFTLDTVAVINLQPDRGEEQFVLLCRPRRIVKVDSNWQVAGYSFERLLRPGQRIGAEMPVASLHWMDVSGDLMPEDPRVDAAVVANLGVPGHRASPN